MIMVSQNTESIVFWVLELVYVSLKCLSFELLNLIGLAWYFALNLSADFIYRKNLIYFTITNVFI